MRWPLAMTGIAGGFVGLPDIEAGQRRFVGALFATVGPAGALTRCQRGHRPAGRVFERADISAEVGEGLDRADRCLHANLNLRRCCGGVAAGARACTWCAVAAAGLPRVLTVAYRCGNLAAARCTDELPAAMRIVPACDTVSS